MSMFGLPPNMYVRVQPDQLLAMYEYIRGRPLASAARKLVMRAASEFSFPMSMLEGLSEMMDLAETQPQNKREEVIEAALAEMRTLPFDGYT
jgi:hypothetical protein